MSGFLACYEQCVSVDNYGSFKQLDRKRVRLITLFFTTVVLFVPAVISYFVYEAGEDSVSFGNLAWPLANTVVFGVLLSENYFSGSDDLVSFKDSKREFLVMFMCTLILELFYYPNISLWGLLICGLLLYVAVRDLDPLDSYDIGFGDESSQFLSEMVMKPIRHILSERKSRKIALFLLINAAYMVVEFVAGFMSNSLGLISDACHMLFDCAALAIGLYASYISRLPANNHYNYGRGRFEVLSGYTNAVFLVLVGALIVVESFERILDPQEISTNSLLVVSVGGLVVNVIGLIFFHEEHHHAHGMSGGSCSHSHPHSELHNHHSHHHHEKHESNREFISISSDCQDSSCSSDLGHHNHSGHERKVESLVDNHSIQSFKHHNDDARQHDHHEHAHDHHHHTSHQTHHDHSQQHGHHEHTHDHHHHTGHHDHAQHHDHNHHDHNQHASHHDHSDCHDQNHHHDHQHHDGHHHHDADHHRTHDASPAHQKQSHRHIDHNMEGIFLHVLADTLGSVGVVISTLLIKYKGWLIADPACSIFISILIVSSVIPLLRNSAEVLLQRVPRAHEHDLKDSLANVLKIKGVYGIQKFHSWSFTNTDIVGTLHLHVSTDTDKISVKSQVSHLLHNAGIKDLTLQVECVR
jgi:zinc transporter 5/7